MRADIATRTLADHRRSLVAWVLGIGLYVALIVAVWPSIRDSAQLSKAFADYPDALKQLFGGDTSFDFGTSAGYLNAELFSLMYPLLLAVFAIAFGASTLAGEEERGVLDLVLAYPVRRQRLVTEKAAALVVALVGLGVASTATMLLVGVAVDLGISVGNLLAAAAGGTLVALVTGALALLVGAWSGHRAAAIGVAAAVFGAAYLVQVLGAFVGAFESLRWLSPMYLANGTMPIRAGWPWARFGVLLFVTALLFAAARAVFARRDIGH
ncbi:MAG: ABC transporter permease subunit [Actinomycetota bacterium]